MYNTRGVCSQAAPRRRARSVRPQLPSPHRQCGGEREEEGRGGSAADGRGGAGAGAGGARRGRREAPPEERQRGLVWWDQAKGARSGRAAAAAAAGRRCDVPVPQRRDRGAARETTGPARGSTKGRHEDEIDALSAASAGGGGEAGGRLPGIAEPVAGVPDVVDEVEEVLGGEEGVGEGEQPVQLVHRGGAAQGDEDGGEDGAAGAVGRGEGAGHVEQAQLVEAELGGVVDEAGHLGRPALRGARRGRRAVPYLFCAGADLLGMGATAAVDRRSVRTCELRKWSLTFAWIDCSLQWAITTYQKWGSPDGVTDKEFSLSIPLSSNGT